jgi:hypothetical protein
MEGDMKKAVKLLLWLLFIGAAWVSQASALQVIAEQRFTSSQGEPVTQDLVFSGSDFADFVLKMQKPNGDWKHHLPGRRPQRSDDR